MKIQEHRRYYIFGLFFVSTVSLIIFFHFKLIYQWDSLELKISRMITIIIFNFTFTILVFLMKIELYKKIFKISLLVGISVWAFVYSLRFMEEIALPLWFWNVWDAIVLLSFSLLGPGIIIYMIEIIRQKTAKYDEALLFGYHVHEGFVGVILFIIGGLLFLLRGFLIQFEIFWNELGVILSLTYIFLFLFLYFGSFLISRDWKDIRDLKLIESTKEAKMSPQQHKNHETFNKISHTDVHFFHSPLKTIYPLGIYLTTFSMCAMVYGTDFLPQELFFMEREIVVIFVGLIGAIVAGAIIGKDWLRLFRRFFPELYKDLEVILSEFKHKNL